VKTRVLESSLNIVRKTLVTLHIHIVLPSRHCNQNLRSIDLAQFEFLTELHAPLQLLVSKHSSRSLADSLPPSLRQLWLNDDATRLWLNHSYFYDPLHDDRVEPEGDPFPIYSDQEVVDVISHFLSDWRAHVPELRVLRLLFHHIWCPAWTPRDIPYLRDTLEMAGEMNGVETTVTKVHERPCFLDDDLESGGQDPPYFTIESIKESSCTFP
jgi:hypothetical protein